MGVAVGHLLEHSVDHERRTIWVVEGEVAALLEIGTVLHCFLTFPTLVATAESAVVHCSVVARTFAGITVLALR